MTEALSTNPIWLATNRFPERLRDSVLNGVGDDLLSELTQIVSGPIRNLVVVDDRGPGGPADIYAALAQRYCGFPVIHLTSPEYTSFVDESTLFLILGSGDTDSVIADSLYNASHQGARIIAFSGSTDPEVASAIADAEGVIHTVDSGDPGSQPGLAELLAPGMVLLEALGAVPPAGLWLLGAADELADLRTTIASEGGLADSLAKTLGRTIPLFVGAGLLGEAAARTWKACYNVTCRAPAFWSSLSDAATVDIHGWGQHGDLTRQIFSFVMLRHDDEHPEVDATARQLVDTMQEFTKSQIMVEPHGERLLTQFMELLMLSQLVALRRADQEGLVPTAETSYRL